MPKKVIDLEALKAFRQQLDDKYVIEGEYSPETSVGKADVADNLSPYGPDSGVEDDTPFVFQSSGGDSDIGSFAQLRVLKGETYIRNQLSYAKSSLTSQYFTYTKVNDYTFTFSVNNTDEVVHDLYPTENDLIKANIKTGDKFLVLWNKLLPGCTMITNDGTTFRTLNAGENYGYIYEAGENIATSGVAFSMRYQAGAVVSETTVSIQCVNLTLMFGADNEPTTIEEYTRRFANYIEHNTGELVSPKSSKIVNIGYNQFDGTFLGGYVKTTDGTIATDSTHRCYTNAIRVIAGQEYTLSLNEAINEINIFYYDESGNYLGYNQTTGQSSSSVTIPDNAHFVRISLYKANSNWTTTPPTGASIECAFHLTWDETKTGYEPYEKHEYNLPNIELRKVGSVYDEIKPNGEYIRRIQVVDLGSLNWTYSEGTDSYADTFRANLPANAKYISYNDVPNIITNTKYSVVSLQANEYQGGTDNTITRRESQLQIQDTSFGTDASALKTSLNGKYAFYELEEPVVSQVDAFAENQSIDDWGTQEFVGNGIPQGCEFFYSVDYKAFIDSLGGREDIDYDASEIVSQTELQTAMSDIDLSEYAQKSMVGFPIITAPSSTTLTADEISAIVAGCVINGTFLGIANPVFFKAVEIWGIYFGLVIGVVENNRQPLIQSYQIQNGTIALRADTQQVLDIHNVNSINGKTIPAYPSSTGTYVLKCVNGTLTWVAE